MRLPAVLLGAAFIDELASGIIPASTPELGDAFGAPGAWVAGLVLSLPVLLGLAVEPALFLLADRRRDRRGFVRAGYLAVAFACAAAALAPSPWLLVAAFALVGPLWGVGTGVAQMALVERDPARAETALARWTFAGAIGDLAGPALLAGAVACGFGWRAAFLVVAALAGAAALAVPPLPRTAEEGADGDEPSPRLRDALGEALRNRRLLAWAGGVALCTLLDEILLVLAALNVEARFGASPAERALVLGAMLAGSAVSLPLVELLLRRVPARNLLVALTTTCAVAFAAWIFAPTLGASVALAALVGLTDAGQYPLAVAQAYRAAPGRPGAANAVMALFAPLDALAPLALAAVATQVSLTAALLLLLAQPLGLMLLAMTARE